LSGIDLSTGALQVIWHEGLEMNRAVIFDLDGTLFDAERAYSEALNEVGLLSSGDSNFRRARATVKSRLGECHVAARNRLLYFKVLLEDQRRFSARELLSLMDHYEKALVRSISRQWLSSGRFAFLLALSEKMPLALITNENTRTQLLKLNIIDPDGRIFRHVIVSEEFGVEKPNKLLFKEALVRLGIKSQNCWMIGDNYEADIVPALEMGMNPIWTTEYIEPTEPTDEKRVALNQVNCLEEIMRFIQP
jgi:putative hydrolase of the HAD superfamily